MPKYGFPAASKSLHRGEQERAYHLHRRKVTTMRPGLDNAAPRQYPHLILRLKQTQTEEEYWDRVDHDNRLLLKKMVKIMETPQSSYNNDHEIKSLNKPYKTRESRRIEEENIAIARRLTAVGPIYSTDKWEKDHKKHLYYLEMRADETKEYTPRKQQKNKQHQTRKSGKTDGQDEYDDDFESDDEEKDEDKSKEDKDRLPEIKEDKGKEREKEKDKEGRKQAKSGSSRDKLPDIQNSSKPGTTHKSPTSAEQSEGETEGKPSSTTNNTTQNTTTSSSGHGNKKGGMELSGKVDDKPGQAEKDANQLFRVAKALSPPTDILLRTMIRRTPKQRLMIKDKFRELYDLDLTFELKNGLGKPWHLLIDALLRKGDDSGDNDDGDDKGGRGRGGKEAEDRVYTALQNKDVPAAVGVIVSLNDKQLAGMKEAYKKEYSSSLETDVEEMTENPEQLLLLTLLKDKQKEERKAGVAQDAADIYEQGEGRWSTSSGQFIRLLETRPTGHMRAVLNKYEQISGGTSAIEAIEQECSKSYAQAVAAFIGGKEGKGKGHDQEDSEEGGYSDGGAAHATVFYKNMNPENATFVNLLVERAEVDLPATRKAYKKKFKSEMHEDLDKRHGGHPTTPCLLELLVKVKPNGAGKKEGKQVKQGQKSDSSQERKKSQEKRLKGEGQGRNQGHGQGHGQKKGQQAERQGQTNQDGGKGPKNEGGDGKKKKEEVKGGADENADADVERLHKAMDGLGTDEDTILDIIISKSNAQRQTLQQKYKDKYKRDLAEALKSELSGDLEEVMLGLLMPPVDYDAHCLHSAVQGLGTNESVLIGILCTANGKELGSIKEKYKKAYGKDLEADIRADTSGVFADLLVALTKGQREQGSSVNEKEAKDTAAKLFKGKNKKLDDKDPLLVELMSKKNKEQFQATSAEYKKLSGTSLEDAIKASATDDSREAFEALFGAMDDPVMFYADSLQGAVKSLGTKDSQLIRIIISRSEVDLPAIQAKFQERHGRSLRKAIEDDTSGDYRKALLKILDKK